MRMVDIIQNKRDGYALTDKEIEYFVSGYTSGEIPDYQASALAMAIYFKGMNDSETTSLTLAMAHSGDMVDLSEFSHTADKHSTGGVGDKTSLVATPIAASLGCTVAKMSGRGLGHTGGTVDKLESIPGFRTEMDMNDFRSAVRKSGLAIIGQSGNLTPADKKLYSLRDVTGTVPSIPLIVSSIMSKKLAAGSQTIVLDVKIGSGAFMDTLENATALAEKMITIGKAAGRNVRAVLTDMDEPLGCAVGNALEVKEAIEVLNGRGPSDLREVAVTLATNMVSASFGRDENEVRAECEKAIDNGSALKKLCNMVEAQHGDAGYITNPSLFPVAKYAMPIISKTDGYISHMNTMKIGISSSMLGAGREKKEDKIDFSAGIEIMKKTGDRVSAGDTLAILYANDESLIPAAVGKYEEALQFSQEPAKRKPLIYTVMK